MINIKRFDTPKFFLNCDAEESLGHSLVMLLKKCTTKEEVKEFQEKEIQISLEYKSEKSKTHFILNTYENGYFSDSIRLKDFIGMQYYMGIVPLVDTLWDQEEEVQKAQIEYAKQTLLAEYLVSGNISNLDIIMLEIVLEKYSKKFEENEKQDKYVFIPISQHPLFYKRSEVSNIRVG